MSWPQPTEQNLDGWDYLALPVYQVARYRPRRRWFAHQAHRTVWRSLGLMPLLASPPWPWARTVESARNVAGLSLGNPHVPVTLFRRPGLIALPWQIEASNTRWSPPRWEPVARAPNPVELPL